MANTYVLVNPHISGSVDSKIKANNSLQAAKKAYKSVSKHFNNNVPKFYFTIQKGKKGTGKYYHFEVKERKDGDNVDFSIENYSLPGDQKKAIAKFETKLNNFKNKVEKKGGKRKSKSKSKSKKDSSEDSSDMSDSDDKYYRRARKYIPTTPYNYPIYYWWYDPYVYNLDSFFVPTFYSPLSPYIEIELRSGL
jgi:hypothetical protein